MSHNKLKAKTLSKIHTLQGNLEGLAQGIGTLNKEDFEAVKTNLINQIKRLYTITLELETDVVDILLTAK